MAKIQKLSLHEAQKIAAGEVVDRPANVVKELVENALDAGATQISVYIEKAGKNLIRIVDNGCGMSPEDAHLCFEQHATSKIRSVDELHNIATFGFRGEALPSIAAVSTVTLITKEADAELGTKLTLEYGTCIHNELVGCPSGTDIAIKHIFNNVPARKKFLKTDETEWRAIVHLMHAFCLDYTNVHFKLFHENKPVFNCHPTDSLVQRVAQLWDHALSGAMLPFKAEHKNHGINIEGAISNHHYFKYDRNHIFMFVNRRWIKNQQLASALIKGYMNVLPQGRYPAGCLFVEIAPTEVDINIHPRKEEVQFLHPVRISSFVQETIKQTLEQNLSAQLKKPVTFAQPAPFQSSPLFSSPGFDTQAFRPYGSTELTKNGISSRTPISTQSHFTPFDFDRFTQPSALETVTTVTLPSTPTFVAEDTVQTSTSFFSAEEQLAQSYRIIGQYHTTYILLEQEDGLFLIDQHAAHERILYELFSTRFHEVATVNLLFPHIVALSSREVDTIEQHQQLFASHGLGIERFSDHQIVIQSTPVHIKDKSLDDLIKQVIGWIEEYQSVDKQLFSKMVNEKIHAQMACKAAIKAGDELTLTTMEQLLKDLYVTPNRFTCPHGRPTGFLLSLHEIEKKFKRKI